MTKAASTSAHVLPSSENARIAGIIFSEVRPNTAAYSKGLSSSTDLQSSLKSFIVFLLSVFPPLVPLRIATYKRLGKR